MRPFDLPLTVAILRRRPTNLVDTYAAGEYRRLVRVGARECLIAVRQTVPASVEVAALDGKLSQVERGELAALLDRLLGLSRDMAPVIEAFGCYEPLAQLLTRLAGMKPTRYPDYPDDARRCRAVSTGEPGCGTGHLQSDDCRYWPALCV